MASSLPVRIAVSQLRSPKGEKDIAYDIHVAKLIQPEVVDCNSREHEVTVGQVLVDLGGSEVELVEDPFFYEALFSCRLNVSFSQRFHDG